MVQCPVVVVGRGSEQLPSYRTRSATLPPTIISAANSSKVAEKLDVNTVLFEEFYILHGTDSSLTCSQNPASENYPETHESELHTLTLCSSIYNTE